MSIKHVRHTHAPSLSHTHTHSLSLSLTHTQARLLLREQGILPHRDNDEFRRGGSPSPDFSNDSSLPRRGSATPRREPSPHVMAVIADLEKSLQVHCFDKHINGFLTVDFPALQYTH